MSGKRAAWEALVALQQELQRGPDQVQADSMARAYHRIGQLLPERGDMGLYEALRNHAVRLRGQGGAVPAAKVWTQVNTWVWRHRAWRAL